MRRIVRRVTSFNRLVFGDNLLGLKALEHELAGRVKCVFIDPPYNTGSAFEHYDDGVEHSLWLSMMSDRLELLRYDTLRRWLDLDHTRRQRCMHYCKVLCDEIFGSSNFVANVIWQKLHARNNSAQYLSVDHDNILVYAKDLTSWVRNKIGRTEASDADFWNPDNDPRGQWRRSHLTAAKPYADGKFEVIGPHGDTFRPRDNRWWSISIETFRDLQADDRVWWGKTGRTFPFRKRFHSELGQLVPTTFWSNEDVGNNREAKQESASIFGRDKIFSTPKPERLLNRIIHIATNPGDLVLDSFAGSGTTGAVAHKMGRRWIMIEMGEHCHTHIIPRLKKVIDGQDPGGITEAVAWKGGGGFRYYNLAPSLIDQGRLGQLDHQQGVQRRRCSPKPSASSKGFTYAPSDTDLLAAGLLHRARLPLRHHRQPRRRPAPPTERRRRHEPHAARPLHRLPRRYGRILKPNRQKDPQARARPV